MKDIKNFEGLYSADESGKIWSYRRKKFLKTDIQNHGYHQVMLYTQSNGGKKFLVHRLIAQTFVPNPKKLSDVNHKNCSKSDNRVENLEWNTHIQNTHHAAKNGRYKGITKLTEDEVKEIRKLYKQGGIFQRELAIRFNIDQTVISDIVLNRIWKHILDN